MKFNCESFEVAQLLRGTHSVILQAQVVFETKNPEKLCRQFLLVE